MSITVHDVLQLDILKEARLIAGKNGLSRQVMRVNFTDCPLEGERDYALVNKGDLYIRSFYMDKDDELKIYDYISFYIQTESACCITLDQYVKEFPKHVLQMADKAGYPIIVIDTTTPYGDLIKEISELIMTEQSDWISENKINRILFEQLDGREQTDTASYLFPNLSPPFAVVHITFSQLSASQVRYLKNNLWLQYRLRFLGYLRGGFLVLNAEKLANIPGFLSRLTELLAALHTSYSLGVSSKCFSIQDLKNGLHQALSANEICRLLHKESMYYDDLSVYNLLLSVKDKDVLGKYCQQVLAPLKDYEKRHSINLLETISLYLENDGDYKKTAGQMTQHENTIRFRINKAKALLGMEEHHYMFIEHVSVALKAEKVYSRHSKEVPT